MLMIMFGTWQFVHAKHMLKKIDQSILHEHTEELEIAPTAASATCGDGIPLSVPMEASTQKELELHCSGMNTPSSKRYVVMIHAGAYTCLDMETCEECDEWTNKKKEAMVASSQRFNVSAKAEPAIISAASWGFFSVVGLLGLVGGVVFVAHSRYEKQRRFGARHTSIRALISGRLDLDSNEGMGFHEGMNPFCSNTIPDDEDCQLMGTGDEDPSQRF